ncbi:kinase-like domain-containing protein [Rhizophagus diaphanus]|nr:kinase-like domain-containing protein [Rhizophagus diaphanus] [Rhizophagus sp. MUCL 43196]
MDNFILEKKLKWIPYKKFKDVEYLNEGGFGSVYKATWLKENGDMEVVLKCPKDLNENLSKFLREWKYHESCLDSTEIINLYGFTRNPDLKYMAIMDYANKGNLRENLTKIIKNNWKQRLYILYKIISGLHKIHEQNLIHCDFHDGNILKHNKYKNNLKDDESKDDEIYISDLGLCQPLESFLNKDSIYGVIPFMAPEILRGKSYTPASDIYSFSMIMWEFTSGVPPFSDRKYDDIQLSLSICKGTRPDIIKNTPQCYIDLMKKCWNGNPLDRPSALKVKNIIKNWIFNPEINDISDINEELKSNIMEFMNASIQCNNLITESHPQVCHTSRLLSLTSNELNEILENEDTHVYYLSHSTSEKVNEIQESGSLGEFIIINEGM